MFEHQVRDNLSLRTFCQQDAPELLAVVNNNRARLRQWLQWVDATTALEHVQDFIQRGAEQEQRNDGFPCAIITDSRIAGVVGFLPINWANKSAEFGYWLDEAMEGKGIVTDCCKFLTNYAFTALDLNRVEIRVASGNHRSRSIPERIGFTQEGVIRDAVWLYDRYVDYAIYSLLKREWDGSGLRQKKDN